MTLTPSAAHQIDCLIKVLRTLKGAPSTPGRMQQIKLAIAALDAVWHSPESVMK